MEPISIVIGGVCGVSGAVAAAVWNKWQSTTRATEASQQTDSSPKVVPFQPRVFYGFSQGSSQHPKDILTEAIREATQSLQVAVYTFTDLDIALELIKAHRRGVRVRIITDAGQAKHEHQQRMIAEFVSEDIPVKTNLDEETLMHLKVLVVDGRAITVGSYNFTKAAANRNEEVQVRIDDVTLAREWERHFEYMWNDRTRYASYRTGAKKKLG